MSDLVKLLRHEASVPTEFPALRLVQRTMSDAADEIERLAAQLAEANKWQQLCKEMCDELADECSPSCDNYAHADDCPAIGHLAALL